MEGQSGKKLRKLWRTVWLALASTRLAIWLLASLGLLMLSGTLFPQLPVVMDESARTTWLTLAQKKYGFWYAPLRSLGLFELYRSPGFLALLAALFVNTLLCTINRLQALKRMIQRQRMSALGTLITHTAVIALLLSLAVSSGYTCQESAIALATGQAHALSCGKNLILRSNGFCIQSDAQGQPVDYIAQVTVFAGEREIRTSTIRLNAPMRAAGIGVWLASYEPGVSVQVSSQEGQALALENETGQQSSGRATLNLSSGPALLRVPSMELELHISGTAESTTGQAFYLQVWDNKIAQLLLAETILAGQEIQVAGIRVTLQAEPFVIYHVRREPGAVFLLLSALALTLGTGLSLFARKERDE